MSLQLRRPTDQTPPRNSFGEVEPVIPNPRSWTRDGEPDPATLDQRPTTLLTIHEAVAGEPTAVDRVIGLAQSFLGYKEGTNNDTIFGTWYGMNHAAWCDMFISYLFDCAGAGAICGKFAYCPSHVLWFKQMGRWGSSPQRGAVVFFSWDGGPSADHVGLVEVPNTAPQTIEGNTSSGAAGSQGNGDGVYRRVRNPKYVLGYGYPDYGSLNGATSATVSLARVVQAAKLDGPRPQGVGTPGCESDVSVVEQALNAEGLLTASLVDGAFGTSTIAAYSAWQHRLGYKGADADGIPGTASLTRLGQLHGFAVTA